MSSIRKAVYFVPVLVGVLLLSLSIGGCADQRNGQSQSASGGDVNRVDLSRIVKIRSLSPMRHEPEWDENAVAIIANGRTAGPGLVDLITDESESAVKDLFHYKIGDVALVLLQRIYKPRGWPFPDDSERIPLHSGDYRDYTSFVNEPGARMRLQRSWRQYVERN